MTQAIAEDDRISDSKPGMCEAKFAIYILYCNTARKALDVDLATTAPELMAACDAGDRARISSLVSSIPRQAWTVIPGQAMAQLDSLRILVWHETAGSEMSKSETVIVQIIFDGEPAKQLSYRFTNDELLLPKYNRLLIDLCLHWQTNNSW